MLPTSAGQLKMPPMISAQCICRQAYDLSSTRPCTKLVPDVKKKKCEKVEVKKTGYIYRWKQIGACHNKVSKTFIFFEHMETACFQNVTQERFAVVLSGGKFSEPFAFAVF